jgi:putative redox protein
MPNVTVQSKENLRQEITSGENTITADEPIASGGTDMGFDPYSLLLAALGACTAMTLKLYARRKNWDLRDVNVQLSHDRIYAQDCKDCETKEGKLDRIQRKVQLEGNLSPEQRQRLLEIAKRCPVHQTLTSEIKIVDI